MGERDPGNLYGALLFLAGSVMAAMVARGWTMAAVLGAALAVAALIDPAALRSLLRRRYWMLVVSLLLLGGLAMGQQHDLAVVGVALSSAGLGLGFQMAARATVILIAVNAFTRQASVSDLAALLARLGAGELGFVLGLALNLLPVIQQTAVNTLVAMRLRGGFRRRRWHALRLLLVTLLVNALRYGDDVVCAAEARGFQAARPAQPGL